MDALGLFGETVAEQFGLGTPLGRAESMPVSRANRLWRLVTSGGEFVIKEKAFDAVSPDRLAGRRKAADFEFSAWTSGLPAPEPIRSLGGELIKVLVGSRSAEVPVRVHRWLEAEAPIPPEAVEVASAGSLLAALQRLGAGFEVGPRSEMHWWDQEPLAVLDRLSSSDGHRWLDHVELLTEAVALVDSGVASSAAEWSYSHGDFKPENCLRLAGPGLAVIDWDECGLNCPRLEAVESALQWSGIRSGEVDRNRMSAFLQGYETAGGVSLARLGPADAAKRVAALAGWFVFMGKRALNDYDDSISERLEARHEALRTLDRLRLTLRELHRWLEV